MTQLLHAAGVTTQKKDTVNIPKILRNNNNGGNSGGGNSGGNTGDPNGGND